VPFYHTIEIRDGVTIEGRYDHRPFVKAYHFPDVRGKRVLDIGRASGFFSSLFERMGAAEVVASDLPPDTPKNLLGFDRTLGDQTLGRLDFFIPHALLKSRVKPVWLDVSQIGPETVGTDFDVVFVGSLLVHLADPMGSLSAIRKVMAPDGVCVIANPIWRAEHLLSYVIRRPIATLSGTESKTAWWAPNIACLKLMCLRAGFSRVELKTRNLPLRRRKQRSLVRHVVVHARP
jgi:SAM-dependent methyltransferase